MINTVDVVMVRVYVMESSHLLKKIMHYLRDEAHVRGVSVFRAISGFGRDGEHGSSLLDLSLDLPLTIEFFDDKAIIEPILVYLSGLVKPQHLTFWNVKTNA
jgi:PII-like signaling protein